MEQLLEMDGPKTFWGPVEDGKFLPTSLRLGDPTPESRCKQIIIGDVGMDAIIFDKVATHVPLAVFRQRVQVTFPSASDAATFCSLFGLSVLEDLPAMQFRDAMRYLVSVVIFHFPGIAIAEVFGSNAYLYHFEERSPYDGPTHGLPVHGQCAVYLYNPEREAWPESARTTSSEMARLFMAFAYSEEPWEPNLAGKRFLRFGPGGICGITGFSDD